jgi:hypothetical protein
MFTFKTKEEYLAYRSEWKEKYARVSKSIRYDRLLSKESSRRWNKAFKMSGATHAGDVKVLEAFKIVDKLRQEKPAPHVKKMEEFVSSDEYVSDGHDIAKQMLAELEEAKIEAQNQYQATKRQLVA